MGFAALLPLLMPMFTTLINKLFPDPAQAAAAQAELQKALNEAQEEMYKAQAVQDAAKKDIITTEMSTLPWFGNWRSYLMMMCTVLLGNYYLITPILNAILSIFGGHIEAVPIPTEIWTLVTVGLGGYIGGKAINDYSQAKYGMNNDVAFYNILKQKVFKAGMTQDQVDAINQALKARDGD